MGFFEDKMPPSTLWPFLWHVGASILETHVGKLSLSCSISWNRRRRGAPSLPRGFNYNKFSCQAAATSAINILLLTLTLWGWLVAINVTRESETAILLCNSSQTSTENPKANDETIMSGFVLNRQIICFIKSNIFCRPWRSPRGPLVKGTHLPSRSQIHQSSSGPQLSIRPWSGNPLLSDPPELPGGCTGAEVGRPSRAKPSQAMSAYLPINVQRQIFTLRGVNQLWDNWDNCENAKSH